MSEKQAEDDKQESDQQKIAKQKELLAKMDWSVKKTPESSGIVSFFKFIFIMALVAFVGFFIVCVSELGGIGS